MANLIVVSRFIGDNGRAILFLAAVFALGCVSVVKGEKIESDPIPMIHVSGGTITNDAGRELTASSFMISAAEITWGQWYEVRKRANVLEYDIGDRGAGFGADDPVHSVTWYDAVKWCNLRSELEGRTPVYWVGNEVFRAGQDPNVTAKQAADGYRLLSDAEWAYAVLKAEQNLLSRDQEESQSQPCFSDRASMLAPRSVESNMSADIWEWCFDLLPGCEAAGRVVRGGRESNLEILCRMGLRGSYPPDQSSERIGFRVVLWASSN